MPSIVVLGDIAADYIIRFHNRTSLADLKTIAEDGRHSKNFLLRDPGRTSRCLRVYGFLLSNEKLIPPQKNRS